ncbi:MAG: polyprenyl synthetase family protein [Methanotrichaceae archaeon]
MIDGWDEYHLINNELANLVKDLPRTDLGEVIDYVLSNPGKRVRPLILIFSSRAFGSSSEKAMNAALAIELVHAASLVHDDILDYGIERRGSPSTSERYGSDAALLAGDYLISKSIELMSPYSQLVIRSFARACLDMAEGEMLDLSINCSPDEYYHCISKKTASLFAASAKIGCIIGGAPEGDVARFERYGMHLGLAYQILDDLEEHLGMDQGKASKKASVTLPRIYREQYSEEITLQMCIKSINEHCSSAKKALTGTSGDIEMVACLEELIDRMTIRGLERCKLLRNLC